MQAAGARVSASGPGGRPRTPATTAQTTRTSTCCSVGAAPVARAVRRPSASAAVGSHCATAASARGISSIGTTIPPTSTSTSQMRLATASVTSARSVPPTRIPSAPNAAQPSSTSSSAQPTPVDGGPPAQRERDRREHDHLDDDDARAPRPAVRRPAASGGARWRPAVGSRRSAGRSRARWPAPVNAVDITASASTPGVTAATRGSGSGTSVTSVSPTSSTTGMSSVSSTCSPPRSASRSSMPDWAASIASGRPGAGRRGERARREPGRSGRHERSSRPVSSRNTSSRLRRATWTSSASAPCCRAPRGDRREHGGVDPALHEVAARDRSRRPGTRRAAPWRAR